MIPAIWWLDWLGPLIEGIRRICSTGFSWVPLLVSREAFFIVGTKLAGPIVASAWQCSQPIFTLLISLSLGWEAGAWGPEGLEALEALEGPEGGRSIFRCG